MTRDAAVVDALAWASVFTAAAPPAVRREAWARVLPDRPWAGDAPGFTGAFLVGMPTPPWPLILHAALRRDGGQSREEWLRIAHALDVVRTESGLPPDHLAPALECYALALDWGEDILAAGIRDRWLLPWARGGAACLAGDAAAVCNRMADRLAGREPGPAAAD